MNATNPEYPRAPTLVEIIQLKWLLAGEGVHLHVERLLAEPDYAARALQRAAESDSRALQDIARRMQGRFATGT